MARTKTILVSTTIALTLAAGIASAQFPPRPKPEIIAARDSLEDAMAHLQKASNPMRPAIVRAYIALAHVELQTEPGGTQSLR